jgi:hypothetical protein
MRDHPKHRYTLLGGLWGAKVCNIRKLVSDSFNKIISDPSAYISPEDHKKILTDQKLLRQYFWPWVQNVTMLHDSYHCIKSPQSVPFPVQRLTSMDFIGSHPYLKTEGCYKNTKII